MWKKTFSDLWISQTLLEKIQSKGYKNPSPIQEQVIPVLLHSNKNVIGQAQTWTWKTAAFAIPMIEKIIPWAKNIQWIVLCPTRELAIQVEKEMSSFVPTDYMKTTTLYGGQSIQKEIKELKSNPTIVVWTPWRIKDHLQRKRLDISHIQYFVLDEADEMLNIGFRQEIEEIFEYTPAQKQVLLFSATVPKDILKIAKKYMWNYELISVQSKWMTNENIEQFYYEVSRNNKFDVLTRIIETQDFFYSIIFCRTKLDVDEISSKLMWAWYLAEWLHGDIDQKMREKILSRFKNKKINILVATDVAARWLDVDDVTHVINYTIPENPETYTHRIWRTARAWKTWIAISFITHSDMRRLRTFERITKQKITKWELPSTEQVINSKKKHISDAISHIIDTDSYEQHMDFAKELLQKTEDPAELVASLIFKFSDKQLNPNNYTEIKQKKVFKVRWWDDSELTRLFVAKWKDDWIDNPWKLLNFIWTETWMEMQNAWRINIFQRFSYIDFPADEAFEIIDIFKEKNSRKPLVVKAKPKRDN